MCQFSKWKLGRKDRDVIRAFQVEEKHMQRHSDLSGRQRFLWSSRYVKDSLENEIQEIIQSQVKKGFGCIDKALNLSLLAGRALQEFLAEEHCESSVHVKDFSNNNMKDRWERY